MHSGRLPPGTGRLGGQCRKWPAGSGGGHKVGKATDNSGVSQARQGVPISDPAARQNHLRKF